MRTRPTIKIVHPKKDEDVFDPFGLHREPATAIITPTQLTPGRDGTIPDLYDTGFFSSVSESPVSQNDSAPISDYWMPSVSPSYEDESVYTMTTITTATKSTEPFTGVAIPPKLMIKLSIHEEVTSMAHKQHEHPSGEKNLLDADVGVSNVSVEGKIWAHVQSSDAKKNVPFRIIMSPSAVSSISVFHFLPDTDNQQSQAGITITTARDENSRSVNSSALLIQVPKEEIGFVPAGQYICNEQVPNLPILLERKVTMDGTKVRIALQVRSKLSNDGNVQDLTIVVAIPEHVDGRTVRVMRGDGRWDELRRIVKWQSSSLQKGESYMVAIQANLRQPVDTISDEISFPVLMRCTTTEDPVSTISFQAVPADGFPASLAVSVDRSARLLHRLP